MTKGSDLTKAINVLIENFNDSNSLEKAISELIFNGQVKSTNYLNGAINIELSDGRNISIIIKKTHSTEDLEIGTVAIYKTNDNTYKEYKPDGTIDE